MVLSYFSDNATAITGYDRYDLLDPAFFISRIHPNHNAKEILQIKPNEDCLEHHFQFKKPDGEYVETRISFQKSDGERFLATWQFLPS